MMLAEAASDTDGPARCATSSMTDKDRYELKIAGMLHDCGKVTTPVHVVDKATKLQTIYDRIGLIDTRFEVLKRDAELRMLRGKLEAQERGDKGNWPELEARFNAEIKQLEADREFLRFCNIGSRAHGARGPAAGVQHRHRRTAGATWRAMRTRRFSPTTRSAT